MERLTGTIVRGLRTPIFTKGDDVVKMATDIFLNFVKEEKVEIGNKDVLAITESVVARCQGNYASTQDIADDISEKFGDDVIGIIFPS